MAEMLKNKKSGYRTVSPAHKPTNDSVPKHKHRKENLTNSNRVPLNSNANTNRVNEDIIEEENEMIRYCSHFNNGGCTFYDKFGVKCRFAHKKAPICNYDGQCDQPKCMFRHTQRSGGFVG